MKVIGQADLDINESDWAVLDINAEVIGQALSGFIFKPLAKVIGEAVQDTNESDLASGSGYK